MSKIVDVSDRFRIESKNKSSKNITFNDFTTNFVNKKELVEGLYILQNLIMEGKVNNIDCIFDYEGDTYILTDRKEEKIKREDVENRICRCPEIYKAVFRSF